MVRRVSHAARHDPGAGTPDIEERDLGLPPCLVRVAQRGQSLAAILGVASHEFRTNLARGQWRRAGVDAEYRAEPVIFTGALMDHMLEEAPPSRISRVWPNLKIVVAEHTPGAQHFQPLSLISIDQEIVSHSITSTRVEISSRGTSADQYATISLTGGRPSPNPVAPGGPFKTSGISSRVNRSTAFRS